MSQSNPFGRRRDEIPTAEELLEKINRSMPHDDESEKAVLSCGLQNPAWLEKRLGQIAPSMFYNEPNRVIWCSMVDQLTEGHPLDPILLTNRLRSDGKLEQVGGPAHIMEIFAATQSPQLVEHYVRPLRDMMVARQNIHAHARSLDQLLSCSCHDENALGSVLESNKGILDEASHLPGKRLHRLSLDEAVHQVVTEIEDRIKNPETLPGWTTGIPGLDKRIRYLQPGRVTVFAGMPSDGKSAIMQNCAMGALRAGAKVGWYSLEMPISEQTLRLVAEECGVPNDALYDGQMNRNQCDALQAALGRLKRMGAEIVDPDSATATDIINDIEHSGYDIAVVDYLQLMEEPSRKSDTRENIISGISRRLKRLAKRTGTHILTASQLNDNGKLRESRAIGQDADTVLVINKCLKSDPVGLRPENLTDEEGYDEERRYLNGEKNRGGARGWIMPMWFNGPTFTFKEIV